MIRLVIILRLAPSVAATLFFVSSAMAFLRYKKKLQSSLWAQADTLYISANNPHGLDMKEGTELLSDLPNSEMDLNIDIALEVAFNEAGIVEGKSVAGTLRQLSQNVDGVLLRLREFLAKRANGTPTREMPNRERGRKIGIDPLPFRE